MATTEPVSPHVIGVSWGRLEVEGLGTLGDAKLYPGGGRAWDWSETGTHHSPGIQPGDVLELLENGAEVIVLGCGMERGMGVCPKTLSLLAARGVEVHAEQTGAAVARYNRLREKAAVGGLFHTTC